MHHSQQNPAAPGPTLLSLGSRKPCSAPASQGHRPLPRDMSQQCMSASLRAVPGEEGSVHSAHVSFLEARLSSLLTSCNRDLPRQGPGAEGETRCPRASGPRPAQRGALGFSMWPCQFLPLPAPCVLWPGQHSLGGAGGSKRLCSPSCRVAHSSNDFHTAHPTLGTFWGAGQDCSSQTGQHHQGPQATQSW